jgi:PilZ domain
VSVDAFLRQRAVNVTVSGRYSLANWYDPAGKSREFACRTSRVSPFQMLVSVPVAGKRGERVSTYFGDFGHLDGWITDVVAGGFLLELAIERARREQLANKLKWLEKRQNDGNVHEARRQKRIMPADPHATLVFADGSTHGCFVIDMSTSGAAVSADVLPNLGTPLAVGACVGRVVRHFREGFAIKFVEIQNANRLEALVARPIAGQGTPTREMSPSPEHRGSPRAHSLIDPNDVVFI